MRFSEEQILIRDMARDFSQRELAPKAAEWDEKGAFAPGVLEGMGQLGLMGMCVPQKWGGAGADFTSYRLARKLPTYCPGRLGCCLISNECKQLTNV